VYVGVDSILTSIRAQQGMIGNTPSKKRARRAAGNQEVSEVVKGFEDVHVPALVIVVAMYTLSQMTGPPSGKEFAEHRRVAIDVLLKLVPEEMRQEKDEMQVTVEELLREAQNGWMEMEWFKNLPETDDADELGEGEAPVEEEVEVAKRGFGTMMTDATDWLSEGRRSEFKRWRADIVKRIAKVERDGRETVK